MALRVFSSTDVGAPVLTGEVGKLIDVLDACLINGYGSKLPVGWTKPYTSTNAAVYQNSRDAYYQINDNSVFVANEAVIRGFKYMTAYDTGTGGFPTPDQMANGLFIRKSNAANNTAVAWCILADDSVCYILTMGAYTAAPFYEFAYFGQFNSLIDDDVNDCLIGAKETSNSTAAANALLSINHPLNPASFASYVGLGRFLMGSFTENMRGGVPFHITAGYPFMGSSIVNARIGVGSTIKMLAASIPSTLAFPIEEIKITETYGANRFVLRGTMKLAYISYVSFTTAENFSTFFIGSQKYLVISAATFQLIFAVET